jgi:hypothetical protein
MTEGSGTGVRGKEQLKKNILTQTRRGKKEEEFTTEYTELHGGKESVTATFFG